MPLSVEDPVRRAATPERAATDRAPWSPRRVGRRERVLLALLVAVMTVVPALVALARADSYRASAELVSADRRDSAPDALAYVREQLASPFVRNSVIKQVGASWTGEDEFYADIQASPGPEGGPPSVVVGASGESPADARRTAGIVARELASGTRELARRIERGARAVALIERELATPGLSAERRRRLRGQAAFIRAEAAGQRDAVVLRLAGEPSGPPLNLADRVVDALRPGSAPRPAPLWAGLAGLITGLALCGLWLVVRPSR
jgi:hypothetical protein